ncbi:MAG: hypothetical protein ACAI35_04035 [Candidatus Methylacidiphilales bacterium]|nr:hypothetical protein [Candidatus Methylacidiphilales bacterium]
MSSSSSGFWDKLKNLAGLNKKSADTDPSADEALGELSGFLFHTLPVGLNIDYYSMIMDKVRENFKENSPEQLAAFYKDVQAVMRKPLSENEKAKLKVRFYEDLALKKKYDEEVAPKGEKEREIDHKLVRAALTSPESLPDLLAAGADPMAMDGRALRLAIADQNFGVAKALLEAGAESYVITPYNMHREFFANMCENRQALVAERLKRDSNSLIRPLTSDDESYEQWERLWNSHIVPLGAVCAVARAPRKDWCFVRKLLTCRMPRGFSGVIPLPNGIGLFADMRDFPNPDPSPMSIRYIYTFFIFNYDDVARGDNDPVRNYTLEEGFGGSLFRCCFVPDGHVNYGDTESVESPANFVRWATELEVKATPNLS